MATLRNRSIDGADYYEMDIDGATYSAVMLIQRYMWKVVATKPVGGKLMKVTCEIQPEEVEDWTNSPDKEEQAIIAMRIGYEKLKDQVRFHEEKALGIDPIENRYADDLIDKAVVQERLERERKEEEKRERQKELRAQRKAAKEEKQRKEEEAMIEQAGDLWGAF